MLRYAELRCKSNFSFLQGASHPDELAHQAAELGLAALAITDLNSLAGIVRAHVTAKEAGLKLIVGAEITPVDAPPVLLYAPDRKAYSHLTQLITRGRVTEKKGECQLFFRDIADFSAGLIAAVVAPDGQSTDEPPASLYDYRDLFGDRAYLAVSQHRGPCDQADLDLYHRWSKQTGLPLLAVNDVQYHQPQRRPLHDVVTAIRNKTTVANLGAKRLSNGERHLKSPEEISELFISYPQAIECGIEIADRCTFSLDELRYEYPEELSPPGVSPTEYLSQLTWEGAKARYPEGVPDHVVGLLKRELALIAELRYEAYFLTVWDLVKHANDLGILCQGRGSAANSAVCFCLGITSVDPRQIDLLFERFISKERNEPPDIDMDFEHERREEIFQYIWKKYGRERAAIVAEVVCYRSRSAVRDVGKALGLPLDVIARVVRPTRSLERECEEMWNGESDERNEQHSALAASLREADLDPNSLGIRHLMALSSQLMGFPRHLSQHVGGFVMTRGPLADIVPIEQAAMPERTVIQWDKNDIDALGILKVDCLALGMLTAIRKCFTMIKQHTDVSLSLAQIPAEDQKVYDMICAADTIGAFQIESRAQMSMLPRLRPRCFYDLVIQVAIIRPGPIQGGMVHPYLRRRDGEEPVEYPTPLVKEVLEKTLGVPLFQEQAMKLAVVAGGFTAGEADQFRRAMGAWGRQGTVEKFRKKLLEGMLARGVAEEFAQRLYEQLCGFGEYGFPESHAASFARLAYISCWLKYYYPAAYPAALLNSQPMGFYACAQLVRDARAHGITVRPIDINHSDWDATLEPIDETPALALRLGFRLIRGLPEEAARDIQQNRAKGAYCSLRDVNRRTRSHAHQLLRLAAADAFSSLGLSRRDAMWQALAMRRENTPLFADLEDNEVPVSLPTMELGEEMHADYTACSLSLKAHPLELLRGALDNLNVVSAIGLAQVANRSTVQVAGLVIARQQPGTAKGTVFITLEDENGLVNLVVWKNVWEKYRRVAQTASVLLVEGRLERANEVVHVIVKRLIDLSEWLQGLPVKSRDFR
jgi:error-prone DNA polymerase